ncbi:MAG TPA: LPXTG cell wall anchor domain-containing protein [Clostridiaceae bacterium]|nr:LPXTG cell wall anchor domain-containing protein [Clostridiaceae bacterium]
MASMTGTGNDESPEGAESYTSTFKMNEDRKVNVVFAKKTYIVNVESDNQLWGSVAVNGGTSATVEYDGSVTLTATASDGYRFVGWMEGNKLISDETPYELTNITSNLDIVGVFEEEPAESTPEPTPSPSPAPVTYYTLNVEVEGPGSVTPASGSFTAGNRVVLLPTANEGARFVGWFGENGSEVDANNGIIMNGNKNLIARFELIAAEEAEEETENVEEFTDETVPESGNINDAEEEEVVVTEQEVTDQEVPYDGPALPQTGGIPMEVLMGAGLTLVTAGCSLLKKKKEDEE